MTIPGSAERQDPSLARDWIQVVRYYASGRRGILILATAAIVGGLALNWNWLAATGIAPILIAMLPCAVMCGLGLCMNKFVGKSCAPDQSRPSTAADQTAEPAAAEKRFVSTSADLSKGQEKIEATVPALQD